MVSLESRLLNLSHEFLYAFNLFSLVLDKQFYFFHFKDKNDNRMNILSEVVVKARGKWTTVK